MTNQPEAPAKAPVSPVLVILLGLLFLFIALIVGAVIFYKNCEQCQEVVGGIAEGTSAMIAGSTAPGTAEMRELGCDEAMAVEMKAFEAMFAPLAGEEKVFDDDFASMKMLMCELSTFSKPTGPECADVIKAWAAAVNQTEGSAMVIVQGHTSAYCQGIYNVDGSLVSDLEGEL